MKFRRETKMTTKWRRIHQRAMRRNKLSINKPETTERMNDGTKKKKNEENEIEEEKEAKNIRNRVRISLLRLPNDMRKIEAENCLKIANSALNLVRKNREQWSSSHFANATNCPDDKEKCLSFSRIGRRPTKSIKWNKNFQTRRNWTKISLMGSRLFIWCSWIHRPEKKKCNENEC